MIRQLAIISILCLFISCNNTDIIFEDFEGERFSEGWSADGEAFGDGPVVVIPETDLKITGEGKIGNGFISSKHDKDEATGSLLSPEFQISRKYLNAKIGGGHIPGKVSLNLIIGDKIIDSVTGDRRDRLKWKTIDMSDHRGEMAKIQILDSETGGWGHILVDQILQSNSVFQQEKRIKEFVIKEKFLNFPMNHSNRGYRIDLLLEDEILGQFDTGLDEENPLFWGFIDEADGKFGAMKPDSWPKQAKLAADGKWDELKTWQDEMDGGIEKK